MKFVCDANLSPRVSHTLSQAGFDVSHVSDHNLLTASDEDIFDWAVETEAVIITADSDFSMLLAVRRTDSPSVVLLRDIANQPPTAHAQILIDNLPTVEEQLAAGAVVSLSPTRLRVRDLPIR